MDVQLLEQSNWCGTVPTSKALERAAKIQLLLLDVDGVQTDGRIFYVPGPDGSIFESKQFDAHDGLAFHMCNAAGIKTGVISGRKSQAVEERATSMKFTYVYQGHLDKIPILNEIIAKASLSKEQIAYVGDDFTDVPIFKEIGLACAVSDGRKDIKPFAHFVTQAKGGHGAVREVVELILKAQDKWNDVLKQYSLLNAQD
jgi:3-deoxy-D-manno-octulosonate 8-phosphate phosphatase (KDO 8-P phosphatase)